LLILVHLFIAIVHSALTNVTTFDFNNVLVDVKIHMNSNE